MLLFYFLGIYLLSLNGQQATDMGTNYAIYRSGGEVVSFEQMLQQLATADVVFIGEQHDDPIAHLLELRILQQLYQQRPQIALSLEMFERDVQLPLDEYLAGLIIESQFLSCTRPWPNYQTDYRPLVEFCKAHGFPVIAANAPRRYVNLVSREGLEALNGLPKPSKAFLPPLPISMMLPKGYDQELDEVLGPAHTNTVLKADSAPPTLQHMKEAQALWDATMAYSIARFKDSHPKTLILHVNGRMHSDHRWGIVDRLLHLRPALKIEIVSIQQTSNSLSKQNADMEAGNFVVLTQTQEVPSHAP